MKRRSERTGPLANERNERTVRDGGEPSPTTLAGGLLRLEEAVGNRAVRRHLGHDEVNAPAQRKHVSSAALADAASEALAPLTPDARNRAHERPRVQRLVITGPMLSGKAQASLGMKLPKDASGGAGTEGTTQAGAAGAAQSGAQAGVGGVAAGGQAQGKTSGIRDPKALTNKICGAIAGAWAKWQSKARLTAVQINGPVAVGGVLKAPSITPAMKTSADATPQEKAVMDAVAKAFSVGLASWQKSVKVPGLPWYPAFAAFPGPQAPPMPNAPMPLASLGGNPGAMTQVAGAGAGLDATGQIVFAAVMSGIAEMFTSWLSGTMVTNVMGSGKVPSFAPPFVPVGPVVGSANQIPGGMV